MAEVMEGRRLPRGDEKKAGRLASWGRRDPSEKKGVSGGGIGGRDVAAWSGWSIMRSEGQMGDDAMISISPWSGWEGEKAVKYAGKYVSRDVKRCVRSFVGKHE